MKQYGAAPMLDKNTQYRPIYTPCLRKKSSTSYFAKYFRAGL